MNLAFFVCAMFSVAQGSLMAPTALAEGVKAQQGSSELPVNSWRPHSQHFGITMNEKGGL